MPKQLVASQVYRVVRDSPAFPALVRSMAPRTLAQMVTRVGLNDAAEIMALARSLNLARALDACTWKSPVPGAAEVFDHNEFINWLEIWVEIGDEFAAERLTEFDDSYLAFCFSALLHVVTSEANAFELASADDDEAVGHSGTLQEHIAYGSYLVAIAEGRSETIRRCLDALWYQVPDRLLQLLAQLSVEDSRRESLNQDVVFERERLTERRGHVPAMGARAFLAIASTTSIMDLAAMSEYDLETHRHLAAFDNQDAIAASEEFAVEELRESLQSAGLIDSHTPMLMLTHEAHGRLSLIRDSLAQVALKNQGTLHERGRELAYLASVLMSGVAIDGNAIDGHRAQSAAAATCNLGLDWLKSRHHELELASEPGLIRAFLVGWRMLSGIPKLVPEAFSQAMRSPAATDWLKQHWWLEEQARISIQALANAIERREFAAARDAARFLSFAFDSRACGAVVPLLDEVPRFALDWIESLADINRILGLLENIDIKGLR
jgi:hypothetical protein